MLSELRSFNALLSALYPHVLLAARVADLKRLQPEFCQHSRLCLTQKSIILSDSAPNTHMDRQSMLKYQFRQNTLKLRPKNAPNTLSISIDLTRPLHEPFKIKELGLLTHIFKESATRRFLWCNSQPLTPSGRRDMSQTMFLPTGRIWLEPFEIILNKTW